MLGCYVLGELVLSVVLCEAHSRVLITLVGFIFYVPAFVVIAVSNSGEALCAVNITTAVWSLTVVCP